MLKILMNNGICVSAEEFSPALISDSGQCFRMRRFSDEAGEYCTLIARGKKLTVRALGENRFYFSCEKGAYETLWKDYFDLDTDYALYRQKADKQDLFLQSAIQQGYGLRILRQEPFETLITFLLSQRKAIPLIKRSVEELCRLFGEQIDDAAFAFPTPQALADAPMDGLLSCGLGYRADYVLQAAKRVAGGKVDLDALSTLSDEELYETLLGFYGVGKKIARCVMLYGYHRLDSVPFDVWMDRAAKRYPDGRFPYCEKGQCGGVLQQYVFEYIRREKEKGKKEHSYDGI